ncbi:hypothetical protein M5K25_010427 [Dendrobium thyrsiflorum]|uniref:GRAM domain-containing protein n=1 Tax=Dendrobium thyrsiflorum TaxID=117978 RepID=A0ABD0V0E7_DENTH
MKNSNDSNAVGISAISESSTPEQVSLYIHCTLFGKVKSLTNWVSKFTSKADNLAQGIRDHVNLGPKITETVKSKISLGTRILQAGGIQRVFRQSFSFRKGEKLLKAFQCYLSTTEGPIAGLLFVSNQKIAFISDRPLTIISSDGEVIKVPYKVLIPLRKIKSTNQIEQMGSQSKRFMQIVTVDNFEFWFMGFLCYQSCVKYLKSAVGQFNKLSMASRLRDPGFLRGASSTISFKDALSGVAASSPSSFPDLKLSSHRGLPALIISDEELSALAAPFDFALVGKFPGNRPSIDAIRKFFFNLKLNGEVSVTVLNPRNVLIKLVNDFDYCRIFAHRSYFVNNCYMKVVKWSPNLDVEVDSPIVPIWISFPHLRPHLFSACILSGLGSLFGRTLKSDTATAFGSRPSVARILVELDVTKKFPDKIWVGSPNSGYVQSVVFDDIPHFCTHCSSLGHLIENCKILHPNINSIPPPVPSALPGVDLVDAQVAAPSIVLNEELAVCVGSFSMNPGSEGDPGVGEETAGECLDISGSGVGLVEPLLMNCLVEQSSCPLLGDVVPAVAVLADPHVEVVEPNSVQPVLPPVLLEGQADIINIPISVISNAELKPHSEDFGVHINDDMYSFMVGCVVDQAVFNGGGKKGKTYKLPPKCHVLAPHIPTIRSSRRSGSSLEKKLYQRMMNSSQEHAIGIPFRSVGGKPSLHEPIVAYSRTTQYGTSQLKQKGAESIIGLVNRFKRKADNLAQGIRDHVSLGPGVSETVKAKLKLGTRILQAGGIERVFKKSFSIGEGERLVKAFQCHLSTTVGPIPGLLFISTEKIAFLSDRSLVIRSPRGNIVLIPLRRIKGVNPSENANKPNQKYIHIATIDNFEFWFMGFVSYQRSFKNLQRAIFSKSQISFLQ